MLIRNHNIVCVASNYFEHPTSKQHVMRRLAEHNHVLWVNYHGSRMPTLTARDAGLAWRRLRQVFQGWQAVTPRLDVCSAPVAPYPDAAWARALNVRLILSRVRRRLRQLPKRPTQLWLFTPDVPGLIRRFDADHTLYYCVDDFAAFDGFNTKLIERLERETLRGANTVIATAENLCARCRAENPDTHYVPHGVDVAHFGRALSVRAEEIPEDIRHIPNPVIGYFGLISEYVDLELIAAAARRRPAWQFVLIGHERCDTNCLTELANVHRLGGRPYERLPEYCAAFDVGIVPFRVNRLTRAVNPIKLREYLAAGLPVVSAPLPEVFRYGSAVKTAETVDQFVAAVADMLELGDREPASTRQALVQEESWEARVTTLSAIVNGQLEPANAPSAGVVGPAPSGARDGAPRTELLPTE